MQSWKDMMARKAAPTRSRIDCWGGASLAAGAGPAAAAAGAAAGGSAGGMAAGGAVTGGEAKVASLRPLGGRGAGVGA